jgi:hypothetical protein
MVFGSIDVGKNASNGPFEPLSAGGLGIAEPIRCNLIVGHHTDPSPVWWRLTVWMLATLTGVVCDSRHTADG